MKLKFLAATLILGLASFAGSASARTNVDLSIGLGYPAPVYYEPAPVVRYEYREYYEPRYYESRPVYYGYYDARPTYYYRDRHHHHHHHYDRRDYRRDDYRRHRDGHRSYRHHRDD